MVPNAVVTDRGRADGRSTGARGGVRENLDSLLTAGPTRGRSDEFPGMASRTPSRPRPAQPPAAANDPDDHLVGNVADEARETIVESLEAIPAAIGSFVQANQDATTWSEADPDSEEWRAADKRIKERGEAVAEIVRNPGKVVDEVIRPYKEDWNSDKPERVVGRAAVDIGTMFIPGVGVGKRVLNAVEALPGGRGPDLDTGARPRPDHQTAPDRVDSAPPPITPDTAAPRTASRSPKNGDRRGSRVLPNPVTQLPTLPRAGRGDSPARPSDRDRRDTGTDTCPTPNSFVPGTPVLLADGTYKPIEQVRLGDRVLATDPVTGLTQARPVIDLIPGQGLKELVRITVDTDGDRGDATGTVTATDEHPFWVADTGRWTDAEDLVRGNLLRTPDGRLLRVVALDERTQRQQVHNLTIEGLHTYYVNVGGQDVLTHNAGGEDCYSGGAREQWRAEQSRRRAERSVADADRPLENPHPNAAQEGHGHGRHGYQTTDGQQATRVRTGMAPDGLAAPASRASRFRSAQAEAEALGRARAQLEADLRDGTVVSYTDPVTGQQLYVHPVTGKPVRHRVLVTTNDPRGFGESAQVARRVGGPSSPLALDANGNRIPDLVVAPQKNARVVYEYAPNANEWRPVTYFPEP
ncbi:hypothetical protein AVR91_0211365 [Amycolatopsis keratiniphila subsp. keratiniphila]|uniref:Hint domain-containing protein n=2 Tax=Amycolatopsis keratiniphila TaxID=129921 RepID=A0A1W2LY20_9PSEU|nr:hypothetical protein AVR91_0211365 [Amycolatopsis keratiniphila subsp. keratiniphila]